jgi:hypothetical protein
MLKAWDVKDGDGNWSIEQTPSIPAMGVTKLHRGKMMREGQVNSGLSRLCKYSSNVIRDGPA